jgi:ribosomal protein S18 acetylase RimI-like enzyme
VNPTPPARLAEYDPAWLEALIPMWRAAFEQAVGVVDPHPIAEQRAYFVEKVLAAYDVRIAVVESELAGFVAASRESIVQLYVFIGFQRRGIGKAMLDWAKAASCGTLWLYTFARNARACSFYESQGFIATARGFEPNWKLDDVRYEWSREQGQVG